MGVLPSPIRSASKAFTLLEVMVALFIFSLVLIAIYSTWLLILKGTASAQKAAAAVQRSRIAIRTIEDALLTVQMFNANMNHYVFMADTSGDFASLSLVARLPESFPGVGRYGDQVVRRVSFYTQPGKDGGTELVMTQAPMLLETNSSVEAYTIVLAKDVSLFWMEFYDQRKGEWMDEWKYTNMLPRLVQVALGQGKSRNALGPQDIVMRIIAIPSVAVFADVQGGAPGAAVPPGMGPPGTQPEMQPGVTQPGFQPGVQPGVQPGFQPGFPTRPGQRR
jgi:prepilin-type N-terminal cleavage/methylation domain-containing protein